MGVWLVFLKEASRREKRSGRLTWRGRGCYDAVVGKLQILKGGLKDSLQF